MLRLAACVGRADVGHKAERLARARADGLPVADGWVLLPGERVDPAALAELGAEELVVRSSSLAEDSAEHSAAGVFTSVVGVRADAIEAAVAAVRASGDAEPARAYFASHPTAPMAVLIQPLVRAERMGVVRSNEGELLIEERRAGEPEWGDVEARREPADGTGALADGVRRLSAMLGGPVDVEYARTGEQVTFLQVRPCARAPLGEIDRVFALAGNWRLDAEHNPRPLSAAQAGLVERVDALGVGARQKVLARWLFVEVGAPRRGLSPIPLQELRRRFDEDVAPDCRARAAAVEGAGLEAALELFAHVYRRYVGELSPSIARALSQLDQLLRMNLREPLALHGALLGGVGGAALARDQMLWELARGTTPWERYCQRFGAWAPAWDVAVACDDEAEARVRAAAAALAANEPLPIARHEAAARAADEAAHELLERLDRMARRAFKALLPMVRTAVAVGEDDDELFFAAQRAVRRALLAVAATLPLENPADVFELPLEAVRSGQGDWRALAEAGRVARAAAERLIPPVAIDDGRPRLTPPPAGLVLRGHATQGRARGRAVWVRDPARAPSTLPADAVLVVPAILPSLAYLLPSARALVTLHGGATSHGATLAREYGVPAVLGVGETTVAEGAELYVDASAGKVYVL